MARHMLSNEEFGALPGGSREYLTGRSGVNRGYYVSRDPRIPVSEGGSDERVTPVTPQAEGVAAHWQETREAALAATPEKERGNVHQGIWTDTSGDTPMSYLDISDRIMSPHKAIGKALEGEQLGIYAAGSKRTLEIHETDEQGVKRPKEASLEAYRQTGKVEARTAAQKKMSKGQKRSALDRMAGDVEAIKKAQGR